MFRNISRILAVTYFIFPGVFDISLIVEVDWILECGIQDVGNSLVLAHDSVVVTSVCHKEMTLSVLVVAGYVALDGTETRGWEAVGDEVDSGGGGHLCTVTLAKP